jgi:hypothetical protein
MKHRFTINIAARHQVWRSDKIVAGLGWEPYNSWSVGDRRMTPDGTELPGTRHETMCSFVFAHDDNQLTEAVLATLEHLIFRRKFVGELIDSGGSLSLNIRLNGQFNCNVDLGPEELCSMSEIGIRLSVECFPNV